MKIVAAFMLCFVAVFAIAQKTVPALERSVSLTIYNESIYGVLDKISAQTSIKFSYNPSTVKVDKKVSFIVSKKPLRSILQLLFDETIQVKQNGNYIILTYKAVKPTRKQEPIQDININGYIYSSEGLAIGAASVYNTDNLLATVSNDYGYYKLTVPANRLPLTIKVAKENFTETSIRIESTKTKRDIVLNAPTKKTIEPIIVEQSNIPKIDTTPYSNSVQIVKADTVIKKSKLTFLQDLVLSENLKSSIRNIKDTAFTSTQVGLIPYVSSNRLLSANTVNDYSFNILIGYSQGVNKMELGGLMNIDRGDVKFVQAAGLINAVGGNMTGAQLAGIGNVTKGKSEGLIGGGIFNIGTNMHGIQVAGIVNVNLYYPDSLKNSRIRDFFQDTVKGIQVAGIANINAGYTEGVRLAGTLNLGNSNKGIQIASLMNGNWGKSTGINLAWGLNYMHDTLIGYNIVGIANVNKKYVEGIQIAGLLNVIDADLKGMQITTLVNVAKHVNGTQIALLNFSDSVKGFPIGLVSFVKNGYHKIEFFGDDILYTQLAFRTGVPKFHNIFNVGIDLTKRIDGLWNFGYGIGSTFSISQKWSVTTDILAQIILQNTDFDYAPLMGTGFLGIERHFHKNFSIAFGPTYHAMVSYGGTHTYTDINHKLITYASFENTYSSGNTLNMWVGAKVSFKFL
jgi:hypothetical protein